MDKIKLNNEVVLMRKFVKQAKVHAINKKVKEVKLLQSRKGSENQMLKAKRKAERFLEEIALLKKMKPDYISKLALSKARDWKEVLLQKNSTVEDRCIALLASYGPVQKEVEVFHNSNKDLVSKISDLIKQWEEKPKFDKNLTKKKKSDLKILEDNATVEKMNIKTSDINQSENSDNENSKSVEKTSVDRCDKQKENDKKNDKTGKQKQSAIVEKSKNLSPNEIIVGELQSNNGVNSVEKDVLNKTEIKPETLLNDDCELELENDSCPVKQSRNNSESTGKSNSETDSNMEYSESENSDSKCEDIPNLDFKNKDTKVEEIEGEKLQISKVSETNVNSAPIRKQFDTASHLPLKLGSNQTKTDGNKLKAITVLNLDDFKDLEEIPVSSYDESSEEEINEDSTNDASQNDPFFLGRAEAVSGENTLIDKPKSNNFVPFDKIFDRKEKQNYQSDYKKSFEKSFSSSEFSSKDSSEFKNERNLKSFKKERKIYHNGKNKFEREHSKNSFQPYKHNTYNKNNFKNPKDFRKKTSEAHGNNKNNNSNDWHHRQRDNEYIEKNKRPHQKDNIDAKPLHPSWEAKRKQKELVNASFKGKKIKFDD